MIDLILNGKDIFSEDDLHDQISSRLKLPPWYGRNLSALRDVMDGMVERPIKIIWINSELSKVRLEKYEKIVSIFREIELASKNYGQEHSFEFELR